MKIYTTQQAAEELGICQSRVRQLILYDKSLKAEKFGTRWMIKEPDLMKCKEKRKASQ